MDEKVKSGEKKVMLVKEAADGTLKAVRGVDPEGNAQTVKPTADTLASLLDVNSTDPALEAFFRKFVERAARCHTGSLPAGKAGRRFVEGRPALLPGAVRSKPSISKLRTRSSKRSCCRKFPVQNKYELISEHSGQVSRIDNTPP